MLPTLDRVSVVALRAASLQRGYVGVHGADAASYLQRMLSNDVEALGPGEACEALLLTPKARVIAPLTVWRRGAEDFLLLTEPELEGRARRARAHALRCEVRDRLEEHDVDPVHRRLDAGARSRTRTTASRPGRSSTRAPDGAAQSARRSSSCCESARAPRARAASWTIGCCLPKPGSRIARSASRRAATRARNRSRGSITAAMRTAACACWRSRATSRRHTTPRSRYDGKPVGRVTSAVPDRQTRVAALAYVRREVPADASLDVSAAAATQLDVLPAPVAQGIERCPAEAEVARSNRAGRTDVRRFGMCTDDVRVGDRCPARRAPAAGRHRDRRARTSRRWHRRRPSRRWPPFNAPRGTIGLARARRPTGSCGGSRFPSPHAGGG